MARTEQLPTLGGIVELVPVATAPVSRLVQSLEARKSRLRRILLVVLFILPSALAVLYFNVLAADRFATEARFIVRSPHKTATTTLGGMIAATGVNEQAAPEGSNLVNAFIQSRDAVHLLASRHRLREAYAEGGSDPFMRFPRLFGGASEEDLFKHYGRMTTSSLDQTTGITTLTVQAFDPDQARRLSEAILDGAERLVNRLNDRSSRDMIAAAEEAVARARARADAALDELTAFRSRESMTDPARLSAGVFEVIGRLTLERAQLRAQIAEIEKGAPGSVQLNSLRNRLLALDDEILRERRSLAGTDQSLAPKIAAYERLVLGREFADRALTSTLHSLDAARAEAMRQQLYLERIVEPRAPDKPRYPYRISWTLLAIVMSGCLYLIVQAFVSNVLAHGEA